MDEERMWATTRNDAGYLEMVADLTLRYDSTLAALKTANPNDTAGIARLQERLALLDEVRQYADKHYEAAHTARLG